MSAPSEGGPRLGCSASELEVGTEFSMDEGRTWLVVRTEPQYVSEDIENDDLYFMASPAETTGLSAWERVQVSDRRHVLLERGWPGNKKEA